MNGLQFEAKVTGLTFDGAEGLAEIVIERYPNDLRHPPRVDDLPADLQAALRVWLAGNQP